MDATTFLILCARNYEYLFKSHQVTKDYPIPRRHFWDRVALGVIKAVAVVLRMFLLKSEGQVSDPRCKQQPRIHPRPRAARLSFQHLLCVVHQYLYDSFCCCVCVDHCCVPLWYRFIFNVNNKNYANERHSCAGNVVGSVGLQYTLLLVLLRHCSSIYLLTRFTSNNTKTNVHW